MENDPPTEDLARLVRELLERVERLERAAGITHITGASARNEDIRAASAVAEPRRTKASLETRIGSNWLNRIGIVAVLVGISFFLNYAFESNWVGRACALVVRW
jgi:uncharacterized membrane protein